MLVRRGPRIVKASGSPGGSEDWWHKQRIPSPAAKGSEWKLSDTFTALTLIGAVASFSASAYKDRELRKGEHADKVRVTAAQLLGKTNALRTSVPSSVLEAQQRIVETKLRLLTNYEPRNEMHALWGALLDSQVKTLQRVSSLQTDPSYLTFYTFSPSTKLCIDGAIDLIERELREGYAKVLATVEHTREQLPKTKGDYVPAALYSRISAPLFAMERASEDSMRRLLGPIEKHLVGVIARGDDELLAEAMQQEIVDCGVRTPNSRSR
ncbi:hypothetical protein HLB44_00565 [Aquincola sp. S2]|uniref:Uncharacterized protein n=1 Tax=Pseudaquabacterium terrae TaxID=2732868 RepID=A0ABX2E966_9BURK|nr:hypothetical protein [Aquabacterium terrae]NRF65466.1 hypothetical protein [Aquabacterium terrae]